MDSQPDANALRAAILSIDAWPDRVVTRTATMAAMEHAAGRNAQSSRLICDCCKRQVSLVAMGDSGAGRTVAHACVSCRRLVQTTMEPPAPPPFPRSCLEGHPNRCGGPDYTPLRGKISWNELHDVLRMMKPNKAPGLDEVTPELLKAAPPKAKQLFLDMVNIALTTGEIPQQWRKGEVTLLAKGGDRPTWEISSHRPITLLNVSYKFVESIIHSRLRRNVERFGLIDPGQEGFTRDRSGRRSLQGQIWKLQHLRAAEQKAILLSLDWSGAFDSISLEALWSSLEGYGFAPDDVKFLADFYGNSWFRVAMEAGETADLPSSKGTRQGSLVSPLLFNLLLNVLLRQLRHEGLSMNVGGDGLVTDAVSAFADDLAGVLTNRKDAQKVVNICENFAKWSDMNLNQRKCVCSTWCHRTNRPFPANISVGGSPISEIPDGGPIKILGVYLAPNLNWERQKGEVLRRQKEIAREVMNADLQPHHMKMLQGMALHSHFRYSAPLLPWTRKELDSIASLWYTTYNYGQGLRSRGATKLLCKLASDQGGWAVAHPCLILFSELDSFARQLTRLNDGIRALYLLDGQKVLHRLGVSSLQAAATELKSREPAALLEDSIAARLVAISAQVGLIPSTLLRRTHRRLQDSSGRNIRPALETTLHQARKNWVKPAPRAEERFRRDWHPPSKYPLIQFDRDDLRHKILVKTTKWTVTERNLQVKITRPTTTKPPPLDERDVWELADRQVTTQKPKPPAAVSLDAGMFRWLYKRRRVSTSEDLAVNLIVNDAAAAEEGVYAPLSWEFLFCVQKTFSLEAIGGVHLVEWPPFFEDMTTAVSLRAPHSDLRRGGKQEEVSPPSFSGCIAPDALRQKPFLLLADNFTERELSKILPQIAGQDWVLVSSGERLDRVARCIQTFNGSRTDQNSSLVLFDTIQPGAQICRTTRWWETGNLETKKSRGGVNIWWSEALRARICDGHDCGSPVDHLHQYQYRLQNLILDDKPRLAWDFSLRCKIIPSPGYEEFLNEAPLAKYRLATDLIVAATDGSALKVQPEGAALITKLGCGVKFRGYDLDRQTEGFTLEDASFRGSGGDDSFQAEAEAIHEALRRVPADKKLVIAYDAEGLVQDLEKRMRSFGAPSANDPTFRPIVKKIIGQLARRTAETIFVKVKSHHGCHLNFEVDQLAMEGALQEDHVLDSWQLADEGVLCYKLLGEPADTSLSCLTLKQARTLAAKEISRIAILDRPQRRRCQGYGRPRR
mmetsp:Transcript_4049/g.8899  ORF Transcript_4049/g.8899 Transcript_4049/m.8899 type:complete len:1243 (-) Transcript_4049:1096-4824(-)